MGGYFADDAGVAETTRVAPTPSRRFGCAGTEPSTEAPCGAPVAAEVDGLPLCGRHAEEFAAEARADVLEVAALYLSRWLRVAREELRNEELARHLETAREGVREEAKRGHVGRCRGLAGRDGGRP